MSQALPDQKAVRRAALHMLARRDYTRHDLAKKLLQKGHPQEAIHSVIATLHEERLLNDDRYTEHYTYARRQKGYGPARIAIELKNHGIDDETIAKHLEIADNAWLIDAQRVWQKHFKSKRPSDFKEQAKQMRFLQYRGFTLEQIHHLFKDTYDI